MLSSYTTIAWLWIEAGTWYFKRVKIQESNSNSLQDLRRADYSLT